MNKFELIDESEKIIREINSLLETSKVAKLIIDERYNFANAIWGFINYFQYNSSKLEEISNVAVSIKNENERLWDVVVKHLKENDKIFEFPSEILLALFKFKEILDRYNRFTTEDSQNIHIASEYIDILIKTYNTWLKTHKSNSKLQLEVLTDFEIAAASIRTAINEIKTTEKIIHDRVAEKDEGRLLVYLSSDKSYKQFTNKLLALGSMYTEMLHLFNLKETEHPLQINKIESGSQWIDIFGYPKVIELLTDLIKNGISYIHRNYTREGRIGQIPKKLESIEKILDLTTKLEEAGVDTEQLKENINKSTIKISQDLNKLIKAEKKIRVNNTEFLLNDKNGNLIENKVQNLLDSPKNLKGQ